MTDKKGDAAMTMIPVCDKMGRILRQISGGGSGGKVSRPKRVRRADDEHVSGHGNPGTWKGTPRKGKNIHQFIGAVRVK